jgi:hypothetical protein
MQSIYVINENKEQSTQISYQLNFILKDMNILVRSVQIVFNLRICHLYYYLGVSGESLFFKKS